MAQRKLQIFLSSTYDDLISERLAAMEAILAAGHIPAAMEQFSPGDETAWEKITTWIDQSDAFILIMGGRYGSIEPKSGKSYVQLEYEYAIEKKKPFFALVIDEHHHEQRVKEQGLQVDERVHQTEYREFRTTVCKRLCKFWADVKDIKTTIFHKLPEWSQRNDLVGWVRGDQVVGPSVMIELAHLSQENNELRSRLSTPTIEGIPCDRLAEQLRSESISVEPNFLYELLNGPPSGPPENLLELAALVLTPLAIGKRVPTLAPALSTALDSLTAFGLLDCHEPPRPSAVRVYQTNSSGRCFRNWLMTDRNAAPALLLR